MFTLKCLNRLKSLPGALLFAFWVLLAVRGDGSMLGQAQELPVPEIRPRVLVTTDVGGTDPDDIQSLVHLFLYADSLELEGLIASPYGAGRKKHILDAIEAYQKDFPTLAAGGWGYPQPTVLRSMARQGATECAGPKGVATATEGSEWIIHCARRPDPRPLHVLVWGGLEDLAQALHDAPEILTKLRVYFIGGPNKKWSKDAYHYLETHHPRLWMIESNATYRGWFVGGDQGADLGNERFVAEHVQGHGALGAHFVAAKATLKMGDSPSVARLLRGDPDDPTRPSWGGQFVRLWGHRTTVFEGWTNGEDSAEVFGITEFVVPMPQGWGDHHWAQMIFDESQPSSQAWVTEDTLRFRFAPRDAKLWPYRVESNHPSFQGVEGAFTAQAPSLARTRDTAAHHPQWWIDDPDPAVREGVHPGARSVSQWRAAFLKDFAERMDRCLPQP